MTGGSTAQGHQGHVREGRRTVPEAGKQTLKVADLTDDDVPDFEAVVPIDISLC